jgi:DNA-binding response OmpR family regulator
VAEDDEVIRHFSATVLAGAGFEVIAARDGLEAWSALLEEPCDLLVTDNEMPGLDGVELIDRLREAGMSLPVIIASGTFSVENMKGHPGRHITAVLPKPFGIWELLNTVGSVLPAIQALSTANPSAD